MILPMTKFLTSVFTKLFVIILLTVLGVNLVIIFGIRAFRHHVAASFNPHLIRYVDYLIDDLGSPPDLQRARQLAATDDMIITYQSPDRRWSTSDRSLPPNFHRRLHFSDNRMRVGSYHGNYTVEVNTETGSLFFFLPRQDNSENKIRLFAALTLTAITGVVLSAYFAIRWVLKPLRWLKTGVDEVAKGHLTHRVPLKRKDELWDLSNAFNTMTRRLSQLMKAKEHLLLDVSHELRSPLTRMKVALAMLPESDGNKCIKEDLDEMEKKITDLLETSRAVGIRADLQRKPVDLASFIDNLLTLFANRKPGVRIGTIQRREPVSIDAEQMAKVLGNIIDNALKYSRPQSGPVTVSLEDSTDGAVIFIEDTGIGIPTDAMPFIFEPFYRADPSRSSQTSGYGLGLSLARTIVDAHGGHIAAESTPGRGTTMRIYLPVGEEY